jgi:hypothetical protein
MTRLFETVANFIAAPFEFFPEHTSETVGAALLATGARKHFVFAHESPKMLPLG